MVDTTERMTGQGGASLHLWLLSGTSLGFGAGIERSGIEVEA